jgi:hypothetical protein
MTAKLKGIFPIKLVGCMANVCAFAGFVAIFHKLSGFRETRHTDAAPRKGICPLACVHTHISGVYEHRKFPFTRRHALRLYSAGSSILNHQSPVTRVPSRG